MDAQLLKQLLFTNGIFDVRRWRTAIRSHPELQQLEGSSPSEKVWLQLHRRPRCFCGNLTKYVSFTSGYRQTCSPACGQSNPVIAFDKRHRQEKLWASDRWKSQTAQKMKDAHFASRTPKKLSLLAEKGITPLDELQPGQSNIYRWKHTCGEVFGRSFARIASIYCPVCHVSREQGEVYEAIRARYGGKIVVNDRTAIAPKELDIYLPELKVAIEYNGAYWHPGDGRREQQKLAECKATGIKLLHVWEREWKKNRQKVIKQLERLLK